MRDDEPTNEDLQMGRPYMRKALRHQDMWPEREIENFLASLDPQRALINIETVPGRGGRTKFRVWYWEWVKDE